MKPVKNRFSHEIDLQALWTSPSRQRSSKNDEIWNVRKIMFFLYELIFRTISKSLYELIFMILNWPFKLHCNEFLGLKLSAAYLGFDFDPSDLEKNSAFVKSTGEWGIDSRIGKHSFFCQKNAPWVWSEINANWNKNICF